MSSLFNTINQRTQIAGSNRFEVLLFRLGDHYLYGMNVFKVNKIIPRGRLQGRKNEQSGLLGLLNTQDYGTLPVFDLRHKIGKGALPASSIHNVVITEYNRQVLGFLVGAIEGIRNVEWQKVKHAPSHIGKDHFLTAVYVEENSIVQILDLEKFMEEQLHLKAQAEHAALGAKLDDDRLILVADDSKTALKFLVNSIKSMGLQVQACHNGQEAADWLAEHAQTQPPALVITDIEMPQMDGYTLTRTIREMPNMRQVPVILHTSLSGAFNQDMAKKVGANGLVAKFCAGDLTRLLLDHLGEVPCQEEAQALAATASP
ncbi:two-component system, chemotaxis family, response regulator CheV [Allopseudospirillum japonicum]|uniref:Two-component system, chemotaxis family, response regulator CheV n=1 Tax=Allopseudospirillum japonicum TaxID=64971 RepID=A0A1H6TSY3_9GAMM|nr:chemotaxis protein [Allopseudospirillum japonicum]SEI82366.1 two-component system, chemotaxis family, response regulator CheV [Allopseudospirillum japonicum]